MVAHAGMGWAAVSSGSMKMTWRTTMTKAAAASTYRFPITATTTTIHAGR